MTGETNLQLLLRNMRPRLNEGRYVFCTVPKAPAPSPEIVMYFVEKEAVTLICAQSYADARQLPYQSVFAWVTLEVHSSLEAVGLTAAFASELARHGLSCNVVAGFYHDHVFVPHPDGERALRVLEGLAGSAGG
jgi:hypothetical protein